MNDGEITGRSASAVNSRARDRAGRFAACSTAFRSIMPCRYFLAAASAPHAPYGALWSVFFDRKDASQHSFSGFSGGLFRKSPPESLSADSETPKGLGGGATNLLHSLPAAQADGKMLSCNHYASALSIDPAFSGKNPPASPLPPEIIPILPRFF